MIFQEIVNMDNVEALKNIGFQKYKEYFITGEHNKQYSEEEQIEYFKTIIKFLKKLFRRKNPIIRRRYKYAIGQTSGRIYPEGGGLQGCSKLIKHFLCDGCGYIDYDIKNCFPTLFRYLLKKNDMENNYLNAYVLNREDKLKKHNVCKRDVISHVLFKDEYSGDNDYLRNFNLSLYPYKVKIVNKYKHLVTPKHKPYNQVSSTLSYIIGHFENIILQDVLKKVKLGTYVIPMFDGFMTTNQIPIEQLNKITERYGTKWAIKDSTNKIQPCFISVRDKELAEWFKIMSEKKSEYRMAKEFLRLLERNGDKGKYVVAKVGDKDNWFHYNEYNILVDTRKSVPAQLWMDITEVLEDELEAKRMYIDEMESEELRNTCLDYFEKLMLKVGRTSYKKSLVTELTCMLVDYTFFDKIDLNTDLLVFKNGMAYDFKCQSFRKIKKEDYILTHLSYNLPDPDLEIQKELNTLIDTIFEDKEDKQYFMDTVSFPLFVGGRFEEFNIWTGDGANGKGVLTTLLQRAYDKYFLMGTNTFLTENIQNGRPNPTLADCKGKKIVMVSEPQQDDKGSCKFNINSIKAYTGGDILTTRRLFGDNFSFVPKFHLFCQTNRIPEIDNMDNANKRRICILELKQRFVYKPTKPNERPIDTGLKKKLQNPKYYQNFMLMLIENTRDRYDIKEIPKPPSVKKFTEEYFNDCNSMGEWFKNNYEVIKNTDEKKKYFMKFVTLWNNFKSSDDYNNCKKNEFKYNLSSLGLIKERNQSRETIPSGEIGIGYFGIKTKCNIVEDELE